MYKGKKIYLDIDGVLGDFTNHFFNYLNIADKTSPKEYDDKRIREKFHLVEYDEDFWLSMPPLANADDFFISIDGYCTSRQISRKVTEQWLKKHGFPQLHVLQSTPNGCKLDILKENKCNFFLDDYINVYEKLNEGGIHTFLLTQSYNEHNMVWDRVDTVREFQQKIVDIVRKK